MARDASDGDEGDCDNRSNIRWTAVCIDERGSRPMGKSYSSGLIASCRDSRSRRLRKGRETKSTLG